MDSQIGPDRAIHKDTDCTSIDGRRWTIQTLGRAGDMAIMYMTIGSVTGNQAAIAAAVLDLTIRGRGLGCCQNRHGSGWRERVRRLCHRASVELGAKREGRKKGRAVARAGAHAFSNRKEGSGAGASQPASPAKGEAVD